MGCPKLKDNVMKSNLKLAYLSLIINLYYFVAWIYVFETFAYEERLKKFSFLFPPLLVSGIGTHILLILFTGFSILIFSKYKMPHILMIVLQVAAGFLYIFQYL